MKGERPLPVRIVTDSTSALPQEICKELGITVVPATVHFGSETYIDGVDPSSVFYARLATSEHSPTTSTPSVGVFLEAFDPLSFDGSEVIAIHLMETKSALINTARMAAQMLPERRIHVVDSRTTTLGLGLLALMAARLAREGNSAPAILKKLEDLIPKVDTHAAIREMTQLRRSGRVSLGKALLAGILAIKPVLYVGQNMIEVADKARGWPSAVEMMVERALAIVGGAPVYLVVVHTNVESEARELLERIRRRFHTVETLVADAGTAIAAHAGAGALGIVTMRLD